MVAAAAFALDEDLPPILAERRPGMGAGRDGSSFHRLAFRSVIRIVLPDPNPQHAASGYETAQGSEYIKRAAYGSESLSVK
jgi:cell wall-associated NlpC family hydrolase